MTRVPHTSAPRPPADTALPQMSNTHVAATFGGQNSHYLAAGDGVLYVGNPQWRRVFGITTPRMSNPACAVLRPTPLPSTRPCPVTPTPTP